MPRDLTTAQHVNLTATATRPITIMRVQHSGGVELLSCSSTVIYNGETYTPGDVTLKSIVNGRSADLRFFASAERIQESVSGNWRGGKICKIYAIPALPPDIINPGVPIYAEDEAILMLDGIIDTSSYRGGKIEVGIIHKYANGYFTPRNSASELSIHIPPAGTVIKWAGEATVLKAR